MNPPFKPPNRDFIGKSAPPGYVAGIGRGATGFTTRSDIGPARMLAAAAASTSNSGDLKRLKSNEDEDENLNESNYDEFAGYSGSLFNNEPYDEEDEEAEKVYAAIDEHIAERGKDRREKRARLELEKYRQERPKLQHHFSDLKEKLKNLTEEDWMNIPEVGDSRNRKQRVARPDKYTPVPDSLLAHQARLASGGEQVLYIENDDNAAASSSSMADGQAPNIDEMLEVRKEKLRLKMTSTTHQTNDQPSADPQELTSHLNSMNLTRIPESVLKQKRRINASIRASNPNVPSAWILSAQLEERVGKLKEAQNLIREACEKCPKSEEVWCEAARLSPDKAKAIMLAAVKENPRSVKLYTVAAELETSLEAKRKIYAIARKMLPKSVELWTKSVDLEEPDEARNLLREAVECCPEVVRFWLTLARLQPDYQAAQQVLVEASKRHPNEQKIVNLLTRLQEAAVKKEPKVDTH